MRKAIRIASVCACVFLLAFAFARPSKTKLTDAQRLQRFQEEVEKLTGKKVVISDGGTGGHSGGTDCRKDSQIDIYIKTSLTAEERTSTLSHEPGHAYLCGKGFVNYSFAESSGYDKGLLAATESVIVSCYFDPLADREARKRGFDPSVSFNRAAVRDSATPPEIIQNNLNVLGPTWGKYMAVTLFCLEHRRHTFDNARYESAFVAHEEVSRVLARLKRNLGRAPQCDQPSSCYTAAKRLRDEAGLADIIAIKSPSTGSYE
jgi:hypothetical protein